jgi:signal transduction histidine kinase
VTWVDTRRIPVLLAAATLVPIGALAWLGMRTLQQDHLLEGQRRRERLEVAAGRLALDVERRLQDAEQQLASGIDVHFLPAGIEFGPDRPILYQPIETPPANPVFSPVLADAEVEEFQRRNLAAAAGHYRRLTMSDKPSVRAVALVGLGRVLRQRGDPQGALDAYATLEQLATVVVAGQPAALVARQGRARVFEEAGDVERLHKEAEELASVLNSGRWPIDRATFELYREMVGHWGRPALASDAVARTEAALELWRSWRRGDLAARGRRLVRQESGSVLALWTGGPDRPALWLATAGELEASWRPLGEAEGLAVRVSDSEGQPVFGEPQPDSLSLTPSETRLPFILSVSAIGTPPDGGETVRRTILLSGLLTAFLLMLAAGYGLYRATTRELLLARQQSDFVSAVSHEFRTPLTSMRHLTDLLVSQSVSSEERKAYYYELLAHETERLHRMVESLLSFGRMDVGAYAWKLEQAEVGQIASAIVEEFRREPLATGRQVMCEVEEDLPPVRADREALSRALWNLLENAGKYSDPGRPIRVFARRRGDSVQLGVGDEGAGIPPAERARIFQKFVRGSDAKRAGIRGVGIGLALVSRIVEAHGGSVQLESEPGRGSTFTLVLPCLES